MSQTISEAGILDRAPMFLPAEHFNPGLQVLSNDPKAPNTTNDLPLSESDESKKAFADNWNEAYQARFKPEIVKEGSMPHEVTKAENASNPLLMSWWPAPDVEAIIGAGSFEETKTEWVADSKKEEASKKKDPSLLQRLEHRLDGFLFGAHAHHHRSSISGNIITETTPNPTTDSAGYQLGQPPKGHHHFMGEPKPAKLPETEARDLLPVLVSDTETDTLFHVVLTSSHLNKDVNSAVQGVRICGTYDSLPAAKAFAHRCLFDTGYELEWFSTFKTQHGGDLVDHKKNTIVQATGPAGEVFTVSIASIPNTLALKSNSSKRVVAPLYHVVQTIVHYRQDESGQTRDTTIQGSFPTYDEARKVAQSLLLWSEDGIDRETYAEYDEAAPGESDCGYGENVIVHAVGDNGENFLISVLQTQELESTRVAEAAEAMRA